MDLLSVIASSRRRFVGLLDLYPGAAFGPSLRVLRTAWLHEPLLIVRRDSDNDEVGVKANLSQMINGNYFLSLNSPLVGSGSTFGDFMGSANGFVVTWYDQSGNARHATQATAGNQPQIVAGGVVVVHPDASGKVGIRFLDTDMGAMGPHLVSPAWHGVAQNPVFAHWVYSMGASGYFPTIFDATNAGSINRGYGFTHSTNIMAPRPYAVRTGDLTVVNGPAISLNTRYVGSYRAARTTNGLQAFINGNLNVQANDRNEDFSTHDRVWIGNVNSNIGKTDIYLSELVTYGADNRTSVEANQNAAWEVY